MARRLTDRELQSKLANGLKRCRHKRGLSLHEAALKLTALGIPCTRNSLMQYERTGPTGRVLSAIYLPQVAKLYKCKVSDLYGLRQ